MYSDTIFVIIIFLIGVVSVSEAAAINKSRVVQDQQCSWHISTRCFNTHSDLAVSWVSSTKRDDESGFVDFPIEGEPITGTSNENGADRSSGHTLMCFGYICPTSFHVGPTNWNGNLPQPFSPREQGISCAEFARFKIVPSTVTYLFLLGERVTLMRAEEMKHGINSNTDSRGGSNITRFICNGEATTFGTELQIAADGIINSDPWTMGRNKILLHRLPLSLQDLTLRPGTISLHDRRGCNNSGENGHKIIMCNDSRQFAKDAGLCFLGLGTICMIAGVFRGTVGALRQMWLWFFLGTTTIIVAMEFLAFGDGLFGIFWHFSLPVLSSTQYLVED